MMVFFALIVMLRDRKLSSSVIFTLITSMNLSGDQAFISSASHKELLGRHKQRLKFFKKEGKKGKKKKRKKKKKKKEMFDECMRSVCAQCFHDNK